MFSYQLSPSAFNFCLTKLNLSRYWPFTKRMSFALITHNATWTWSATGGFSSLWAAWPASSAIFSAQSPRSISCPTETMPYNILKSSSKGKGNIFSDFFYNITGSYANHTTEYIVRFFSLCTILLSPPVLAPDSLTTISEKYTGESITTTAKGVLKRLRVRSFFLLIGVKGVCQLFAIFLTLRNSWSSCFIHIQYFSVCNFLKD